jgi:hypothetical protein
LSFKEHLTGWIALQKQIWMHMTNAKGKKVSQSQLSGQDSTAEYVYIIENKEVWFIDVHWSADENLRAFFKTEGNIDELKRLSTQLVKECTNNSI